MKPFVRVDLNEDKKEGTNMKESDLANTDNGEEKPNWGGAVIQLTTHKESYLRLGVWDKDAVDNDLIGETTIQLDKIKDGSLTKGEFEIKFDNGTKSGGKINLEFSWMLAQEE